MDPILIGVIAFVVVAIIMGGRSKKKKSGSKSNGWFIGPEINGKNHSVGMPERPTIDGTNVYFDFPTTSSKHVHYLQWFDAPSLVGAKEISIRFSVTGGGFIAQQFPQNPARVSLMIQRQGDNWSAYGPMQSYRYFSRDRVVLAPGEFTLTVPLDSTAWADVYSNLDPATKKPMAADMVQLHFNAAIREMSNISILFGSHGGAGHGVYATQPSRFTIHEIKVIR